MRTKLAIVLIAASISGLTACSSAEAASAGATNVPVTVHDVLKPNAEILISSPCGPGDTRAELETSFGASTVMSPAADMGELIGYVTAPNNIGPGPANGHHTATVRCESGLVGTVDVN